MKGKVPVFFLWLITLPTVPAIIFCFCNSPSCLQAVCESKQRCFTQLVRKSSNHGNVSTSVVYGCSEELNSNSTCAQSSRVVCCDKQLCNMPNILRRKAISNARRKPFTITHAPEISKNHKCKCATSSPAMRVASVVAPCVLILTVILLSLAICRKMSRYEKNKKFVKQNEANAIKAGHKTLTILPVVSFMDPDVQATRSTGSPTTGSCGYHTLATSRNSV